MGLRVLIVTGPRRAGKSLLIHAMVKEICRSKPHYVRLAALDGSKKAPYPCPKAPDDCGVATATWVDYLPDRVFEVIPGTISAIQHHDRDACVIMEADADPNLRHAYPYDCQVFVMPAPECVGQVFRSAGQARAALQLAMHDTSVFTREVYGAFAGDDSDSGIPSRGRAVLTDAQMLSLLRSPLGAELATRIQLQDEYHGLVDADVIVVNTGAGPATDVVDDVVQRLEQLLAVRQRGGQRSSLVFCCDPCDADDPRRAQLFAHLARLHRSVD